MYKYVVVFLYLCLSPSISAQTVIGVQPAANDGVLAQEQSPVAVDKPATTDKSVPLSLLPYDQSRVLNQAERDTLNYRLALAPYKKRQNRWQPELERRLKGYLYSETHELSSGFDEQEVFDFYKSQIPDTAQVLFSCERRDCGESNNWANDHFRVKQLYGLDQFQFYAVYQLDEKQYITLYVVRRGNRRVYAHIDILLED